MPIVLPASGRPGVSGLALTEPGPPVAMPAGVVVTGEVLAGAGSADPALSDPALAGSVRGEAAEPAEPLPQPASGPARMRLATPKRQVSRIVRG